MTTQAVQTRTIAGREIPPPGRYRIDPSHSQIEFVARHMMIARTRGRFREFSGTITIAEVPEQSSVE
jgi:polyisoprenoid-binding protein YceI